MIGFVKRKTIKRLIFCYLDKKEVKKLANINKIKELCKEKGISLAFVCKKINKRRTFFGELESRGGNISEGDLEVIADVLGTTVDYLTGKSDEKNAPVVKYDRRTREFISRYEQLSPEQKKLVDALLAELSKD